MRHPRRGNRNRIREFLRDGFNCLLFPAGDRGALVQRLHQLAHDPALRARLVSGGSATADELDVDRLAETFEAWHAAAAERFAGGPPSDRVLPAGTGTRASGAAGEHGWNVDEPRRAQREAQPGAPDVAGQLDGEPEEAVWGRRRGPGATRRGAPAPPPHRPAKGPPTAACFRRRRRRSRSGSGTARTAEAGRTSHPRGTRHTTGSPPGRPPPASSSATPPPPRRAGAAAAGPPAAVAAGKARPPPVRAPREGRGPPPAPSPRRAGCGSGRRPAEGTWSREAPPPRLGGVPFPLAPGASLSPLGGVCAPRLLREGGAAPRRVGRRRPARRRGGRREGGPGPPTSTVILCGGKGTRAYPTRSRCPSRCSRWPGSRSCNT